MKFFVAISVAILFGLAAAQSAAPVHEDAHLVHSNRTAKFLDTPDPVLKLFRPVLMEKVTDYGNQMVRWFNTLDKSDVGLPLMFVGIVGMIVSLVLTIVSAVGLDKGAFDKVFQTAGGLTVHPKPLRTSRVLNPDFDDVTTKVYQALDKFLEQKSD